MFNYSQLKSSYTLLLTSKYSIKDDFKFLLATTKRRITENSLLYSIISREINLPWYILAVIHYRECGLDFGKHIHNGDSLSSRTQNVPSGRPVEPPRPQPYVKSDNVCYSFFHSCQDWAKLKDPQLAIPRMHGWSNESVLWFLEANNGFGYRYRDINSPYLWSGTSLYDTGYFVEDGVYNPEARNLQLGCVPLLSSLMGLDTV